MKRLITATAILLGLAGIAYSAESFYNKPYPKAWSVEGHYAEPQYNPMCLAEYDDKGVRVQFIKDLLDGEVYIVATSEKWNLRGPLITPQDGRLEFRGGSVNAFMPKEYQQLNNKVVAFRFLDVFALNAFQKSGELKIILKDNSSLTVPLKGSKQAVTALAECLDIGLKLDNQLFKFLPPKKPQGTPI